MPKYYITTTLPYVNADPHIGFALELIQADALARYKRLCGYEVIFNTGTDEHGKKIYEEAVKAELDPQAYCDLYAAKFDGLKMALNVSYTNFIRTTNKHHVAAAQEFWKRCHDNGDIYKKNYQTKYCVGCELEKTDSELDENGQCPIHPTRTIEYVDEENYFFRFSKYQDQLLELYKNQPDFVIPSYRQEEIRAFVDRGLQDFSISRIKEKMPWGVPVPGDEDHVMYVWFDALVNYISTLGWPNKGTDFDTYWPGVQVAGKDNLRQQSAMWQAMMMSAGIESSKQVFIHGFITSEGQKMSKSTGNVVDPYEVVGTYGVDAARFYLLGAIQSYDDGDFSRTRFEELYGAHLANGIGNLTSRVLTMLIKYNERAVPEKADDLFNTADFWKKYEEALSVYHFDDTVSAVNEYVSSIDKLISDEKPWEKEKAGEDISPLLYSLAEALRHIGMAVYPLMPHTGERILSQLSIAVDTLQPLSEEKQWGRLQPGTTVEKGDPLFPRLEKKQ